MVKVLKTDSDLQQNSFEASETVNHPGFVAERPQPPPKQTRRKRVRKTIEENYIDEEPIVTNSNVASSRHDDATEEFEDGDDEIDAALNAFQDPFSGFGDGPLMLKVYRLPPSNPRGHSRGGMQFVESYTFDPELYETQLRDNFPEGGDFYLVLTRPNGTWLTKKPFPLAPKPGYQGNLRANPEKSNLSQPDANTTHQEPDRFARFGEQFLEKALSRLLDAPATPVAAAPTRMEELSMRLLEKQIEKLESDPPRAETERPPTWTDVLIEFVHANEGMGTELFNLAKSILPKLIFPNITPQASPSPQAHDATGEVVQNTIETDAIDITPEPEQPPPNKPTWEQAAAQSLAIAIDAILNSKPVTLTAQYISGLAIDYPDAPVNYKVLIPLAPPDQVLALLIEQADAATQNKLQHTPEAPQWIKQLQAELKK